MNQNQVTIVINDDICNQMSTSEYIDVKRIANPMETIVLFVKNELKEVVKGPQVANFEDYQKKEKNSDYGDLKVFSINDGKLAERVKHELIFKTYDFKYRFLIEMKVGFSYRMIIENYEKFILAIAMRNTIVSYDYLAKLMTPRIEYSIHRTILSIIKERETSFFEVSQFHSEIIERINQDIKKRISEYGIDVQLLMGSIDYVDSPSVTAFQEILVKSIEMEMLQYSYQQEHYIDFIEIVDDAKRGE
ncbi:MAG: hypothetical protein Q7I99_08555 [Acholeplasmataceae bacterium]|nr:hypothetical protein [Acholeplasmataceae bacterium]